MEPIHKFAREKFARHEAENSVYQDHEEKKIQKLMDEYVQKVDRWIRNSAEFTLIVRHRWDERNRKRMKIAADKVCKMYSDDLYRLDVEVGPDGCMGSIVKFYFVKL